MRRTFLLPLLVLAACGYTDSGAGTHTLRVAADASFLVGDGSTQVSVAVYRADLPVDDASVEVKDGSTGSIYTLARSHTATYDISLDGYRRRLELRVIAGAGKDQLVAKLEGPGPHVIVNPKAGGLTRASQGSTLDIEWATSDGIGADEVHVGVGGGFAKVLSSDSGHASGPKMRDLPSGSYWLSVTRVNSVDLAGGVAGSVFSTAFTVTTDFDILD